MPLPSPESLPSPHCSPSAPNPCFPEAPAWLLPSQMAFREGKGLTTCSSHGSKGICAGNAHVKSSPAHTGRSIEPSPAQRSQASRRLGPNPITPTQCWAPSGPLQSQQELVRSLAANVCLWSFTGRARVPGIEGPSASADSAAVCSVAAMPVEPIPNPLPLLPALACSSLACPSRLLSRVCVSGGDTGGKPVLGT